MTRSPPQSNATPALTPGHAPGLTPDPASGFVLLKGYFDVPAQRALIAEVFDKVAHAPFYRASMPRTGTPMRVRNTNFGPLGWMSDKTGGYRYQATHPETGAPWPGIPQALITLWRAEANWPVLPQACLVNWYDAASKMGLHVDADEDAEHAPVVSVSLGDQALFRLGGPTRGGPTRSFWLSSGDVVVLGGASRRWYHGVDRIRAGSSRLVPGGGRINLTLRRVTAAGSSGFD
jgi:DNA oxidative demethylase